jgi:hypothetical protein
LSALPAFLVTAEAVGLREPLAILLMAPIGIFVLPRILAQWRDGWLIST